VLAYGVWLGWISVLLLARSGWVHFVMHESRSGILNFCLMTGYPKQQDFAWFAAMLLAAPAGAWLSGLLYGFLSRAGHAGHSRGAPLSSGIACAACASFLAFADSRACVLASSLLLVPAAMLPWFDRGWYDPPGATQPEPPPSRLPSWRFWLPLTALVSILWIFDSCANFRNIDGFHEGLKLLYLQESLSGLTPGVHFNSPYGPLYIRSIDWWMRFFGFTYSEFRRHFLFLQIAGCALHLLLLRAACRSRLGLAAGTWLTLTMSSTSNIEYTFPSCLRTAIPMAAVLACWAGVPDRKRGFLLLSGVLTAMAALFSAEYAAIAVISCSIVFIQSADAGNYRRRISAVLTLAGAAILAMLLLTFATLGPQSADAIRGFINSPHAVVRLLGHGFLPFPEFPWFSTPSSAISDYHQILTVVRFWFPGMLCAGAVAWLAAVPGDPIGGRRPLILAMIAFTVLVQIPALARPMNQQLGAAFPPAALLTAMALDAMRDRGLVMRRAALASFLAVIAFGTAWMAKGAPLFASKAYLCLVNTSSVSVPSLPRLGRIHLDPKQLDGLNEITGLIRSRCRPDERVYLAAPFYSHLCFIADRAAMPPYPLANLAVTSAERAVVMRELQATRPPIALITMQGIDIPFPEEHTDEWLYINKNYNLRGRYGPLLVYELMR